MKIGFLIINFTPFTSVDGLILFSLLKLNSFSANIYVDVKNVQETIMLAERYALVAYVFGP